MFTIKGDQISFRVNDLEKDAINSIFTNIQERENIVFASARDAFNHLFSSFSAEIAPKTDEIEITHEHENEAVANENTTVFTFTPDVVEAIYKIKVEIGYETEPTIEQLLLDCIEIATTPVPQLAAEKETVEIEVERLLNTNEIIVQLSSDQQNLLVKIARFRSSKKIDTQALSSGEVIKSLAFQSGTLVNYFDEFETGIRSNKIKK